MVGNEKLSPFLNKKWLEKLLFIVACSEKPTLPQATSKTKSLEMNFHGRVAVCVLNLPSKDWHFIFTIADPKHPFFCIQSWKKLVPRIAFFPSSVLLLMEKSSSLKESWFCFTAQENWNIFCCCSFTICLSM